MIVRRLNGDVQVVLQTDHDDLSGEFAARFGGEDLWDPAPREAVVRACAEHDEGWHDGAEAPEIDPESGRAWNFRDLEIYRHIAFYRSGIGRVIDRDPYAGMMVSMHGTGIYRRRHGLQPEMVVPGLTPELEAHIEEFVAEQEARQEELKRELGAVQEEVWSAYRLLQAADRFSLYFCMDRPEDAQSLGVVPGAEGEDVELTLGPIGEWRVRLDPFPFTEGDEQRFTLERRVLPDRVWDSDEEFGEALFAAPLEPVEITVSA